MNRCFVSDERLGELIKLTDTLEKPHIEELRAILLELRELRAAAPKATATMLQLAGALERCRAISAAALAEASGQAPARPS